MKNALSVNENSGREARLSRSRREKRPRMTQSERTALSDFRMFEAATTLICEKGAHRTTLSEIGRLAGYSRGLASHRFGSKDGLIKELITFYNHNWIAELDKYAEGRTGLSAFLAANTALEHFLLEQPAYLEAMYTLWYEAMTTHADIRRSLAEQTIAQRTDVAKWILEAISEGTVKKEISPSGFAVQYCSFVFGTVYQILVDRSSIDIRATFKDYRMFTLALIVSERGHSELTTIVLPSLATF